MPNWNNTSYQSQVDGIVNSKSPNARQQLTTMQREALAVANAAYEEWYRLYYGPLPAGTTDSEAQARITSASAANERYLQYTNRSDIVGQALGRIFTSNKSSETVPQTVPQAIATTQTNSQTARVSSNDPETPPPPAPPATANDIIGTTRFEPVPDRTSPTGYRDQLTGLPYDPNAEAQVEEIVVEGTRSEISVAPVDHRVRIKPLNPADFYGEDTGEQNPDGHLLSLIKETNGVIFPYTPSITYGHQVNYGSFTPTHANQDYQFYSHTSAVQFQVSAKFTAQNEREGQYLLAAKHFFQTASKMHFGEDDDKRGLPPPIMILSGYGDFMLNNLPVILNNFTVELPDDQDYVKVEMMDGTSWVPAVMVFQLTFTVQQTPSKQRSFNFDRFASGELLKSRGWI